MSQQGALVSLTVDQDASLPSLSVNGTLLHAEAHGNPSDPLLIVVHGGPGGDYRSLLNAKELVNDGFMSFFMINAELVFRNGKIKASMKTKMPYSFTLTICMR